MSGHNPHTSTLSGQEEVKYNCFKSPRSTAVTGPCILEQPYTIADRPLGSSDAITDVQLP